MALTEKEELELLQLEEEEYQSSLANPENMVSVLDTQKYQDSPVTALAAGLGNSFGFSDELGAGIQKGLDLLPGSPGRQDEALMAQGFTGDIDSSYETLKAQNQAERLAIKKANPNTYGAGVVAGTLGTAGLSLTGRALQGMGRALPAIEGGLMGAIEAAGESEGSIANDPIQLTKDIGKGAFLGSGLGYALGKVLNKQGLQKQAQRSALKSMGVRPKDVKGMSEEEILDLGQTLLDGQYINLAGSAKKSFDQVQKNIGLKEDQLVNILNQLETAGVPLTQKKELAKRIKNSIQEQYKGAPPEEISKYLDKVDEWLEVPAASRGLPKGTDLPEGLNVSAVMPNKLDGSEVLTPKELQNKKVTLNKFIKDAGFSNDNPGLLLETYRKLRQGARGELEDLANKASDPAQAILPTADQLPLKQINKDLGKLYKIEDLAERANTKDLLSPTLDFTDKAAMLTTATSGNPITAIAGAALKAGKNYGDNAVALGANKLAKNADAINMGINYASRLTSQTGSAFLGRDMQTAGRVQSLSEKEPQELQQMAEQFAQSSDPKDQQLGELLAIASQKQGIAKTAELFKLMQNPEYRTKLNNFSE